jgi:membrane-associated phospholipid phosphatase
MDMQVRNNTQRIKILCIAFSLMIAFYFFSNSIRSGFMKQTDFAITVKVQERIDLSSHLRLVDIVGNIMEGSSFFASPEFSVLFLVVLTGIVCIDIKNKKFRISGLFLPVLFGLLVVSEIYGKTVIHHPAPPFFMIKNPTTIFPKYYINDQFSYPSGHTARAVFLSFTLYSYLLFHSALLKGKKFRYAALIGVLLYIGLVSISRIYLGHHWFSDIVGGALIGSALFTVGLAATVY